MSESNPQNGADRRAQLTADLAGFRSAKEAFEKARDAELASSEFPLGTEATGRAAIVDKYTARINDVTKNLDEAKRQLHRLDN